MMLLKTAALYQNQDAYSSGYSSPSSDDHLMAKDRVSESDYSDVESETRVMNEEEEEEEYTSYNRAMANVKMNKKRPAPTTAVTAKPKTSGNSKKKNKVCEFCGTNDTPMWRRGPQGKGTLCNACGVKWSLKYRKKNGKEQVASVTSKPMNTKKTYRKEKSPGIDSQSQEEDDMRDTKRRRGFDSNDENSLDDSVSSGDDVERAGSRLFGSLLNVVENKLVEAQELEALKAELDSFKVAAQIKSEQQQRLVEQTQIKLMSEMQEFRRQFTAVLAANEATVHNKLERVEYETREVTRKTDLISRDLEELKTLLKLELVGAFASKIEGIEYQVSEMKAKLENKCQELRDQVQHDIFGLKGNLLSDYHYSERKIMRDIDNLKKLSHLELDSVQKQTNRMDYLLEVTNQ